MRHATEIILAGILHVLRWIGIEGTFLTIGVAILSLGAGLMHPAGPYAIVGLALIAYGLALAIPRRT